jgi:hypothetical protein
MIELYLDSKEEAQIRSSINSSDGKGVLDGYAHEALSTLLFSSSRREAHFSCLSRTGPAIPGCIPYVTLLKVRKL